MDLKIKRSDAIKLFSAVNGLTKFSTQAGFYIGINDTVLSKVAKEHDKFFKTLQLNFATKAGEDNAVVYNDETREPKIEGKNLLDFEEAYEKYLEEEITITGLRPFGHEDLKVRHTANGKSELLKPDLPGLLLGPCIEFGLITGLDLAE